MGFLAPIVGAIGANAGTIGGVLGGIAGAGGSQSSQTTNRVLGPASALETQAGQVAGEGLSELQGLVGQGAGASDVTAGLESQRGLADRLQTLSEQGAFPSQQETLQSQDIAGQLFQARRVGLEQSFEQQNQRTAQLAAQLGRSADDPILQARLAQQQTQAQERLGAEQNVLGAQLALQQPFQRLQFQQQRSQVLGGLATQALQNRQALASLGTQIRGQEQSFRLGSSGSQTTQQSGGGLGGFLSGAFSGAAGGIGLQKGLGVGPFASPSNIANDNALAAVQGQLSNLGSQQISSPFQQPSFLPGGSSQTGLDPDFSGVVTSMGRP